MPFSPHCTVGCGNFNKKPVLTLAQLALLVPHNEMLQSRTNNYIRACIQKISFDTKNVCYYRCKWLKELLSDVIVSVLWMLVLLFTLVRDANFFISVQPRHVHIQLSLRLLWWVTKNAEKYFWYCLEKSRIVLLSNKSCIHDRSSWTAWICCYTVMNMILYVQFWGNTRISTIVILQ